MRTPNGRVKVFDFGIAKVSAACLKKQCRHTARTVNLPPRFAEYWSLGGGGWLAFVDDPVARGWLEVLWVGFGRGEFGDGEDLAAGLR